MKYPVSAPLIGPWLYRRSVKELKDRALQGDEAAVLELADILCTSRDRAVQDSARTALCSLFTRPAIDAFCDEALARDNAVLYGIATDRNFLPSDPGTQALFLFITGQWERYARCDPLLDRPLLAVGYARATNRGRFQARSAAHAAGRCSLLAAALWATGNTINATTWSEEEWEIVVTGLVQEQQWEGLWRLVVHAPLGPATAALSAIKAAGWRPDGDEQALWEELIRTIPGEWTWPVPQDAPPVTSWSPDSQPLRLAFSGDGALLAAGCADGTVALWNTRAGTRVYRIPSGQGTISGLAVSPDKTRLLCTGTNGTLRCHDIVTGTLLWSVASGEHASVEFTCTRHGIAVVPLPGGEHIRIVNLEDGQVQTCSGGHRATVTSSALSSDHQFYAVGYADGAVGIWDLQQPHYQQTLEGLGDPVRSLSFCESDEEILVIHDRNHPARWHTRSGLRVMTYTGTTGAMGCCAISPDGSSFAIAGDDRVLRVWQAGNAPPVAEHPLFIRPLTACALSPDGAMLAAGWTDGTLRIYAMNKGTVLHEKKAHKQAVTSIALSAPADLVASAGGDGTVKLWNITTGELVRTLLQPAGGVTGMTATHDGSTIYAGYTDGTVRQITGGPGEIIRTLDMYTNTVRAIAINPDGTRLACAGGDTTLRCWNCETGGLVTGIEGLTTTQRCLTFSPDKKTLVSGGWDGKVRLWSMPDGLLLKTLTGHTSTVTTVAITPNGTLLATGSNDRSVRLWTLGDGRHVSVREDTRSEVSALALSPHGSLLAFAGADAIIHLCYLPEGIPAPAIPSLPGKVTALAFAADGRVLVAGLATGTVAVFSVAGRHLLRATPAHTGVVTGIVVLPGGESVLTSGLDGQVRRWNLPWTRPLSGTMPEDIPLVERYKLACTRPDARASWSFLHGMLMARFAHDIELCTTVEDVGEYDIQIVG
jgi:WD40 repeat protein